MEVHGLTLHRHTAVHLLKVCSCKSTAAKHTGKICWVSILLGHMFPIQKRRLL